MNTAPVGARVVAEAICGETDRYRLFDAYGLEWNGGPLALRRHRRSMPASS